MKRKSVLLATIISTSFLFFSIHNTQSVKAFDGQKALTEYTYTKGYPSKLNGVWVSEYLRTGYPSMKHKYARQVWKIYKGKPVMSTFYFNNKKKMTGYGTDPITMKYTYNTKIDDKYALLFGVTKDTATENMLLFKFNNNKMSYKYVMDKGENYDSDWFRATRYDNFQEAHNALNFK